MSSPVQPSVSPSPSSTPDYRPLSPLALVGLGFALPSLLVYVLNQGWVLIFLAGPGMLISLYARYRIRRSEGTLAGAGIAGAGLVIGLISLLGWTTKYFVEYLIVRSESAAFGEAFLQKFAADPDGKYAFLDTLPAPARKLPAHVLERLDGPDGLSVLQKHFSMGGGSSPYDMFRQDILWAMLLRYGDRVEWQSRGVGDWHYNRATAVYKMQHRYRMRTPELEGDVVIEVASELVQEENRRVWRVETGGQTHLVYESIALTDYGRGLHEVQSEAQQGFQKWMGHMVLGNKAEALAMTVADDPSKFDELYARMRGTTPPGQRAQGGPKNLLLLKDATDGSQWRFTFLVLAETQQHDMNFQVTMKGRPGSKIDDWRVVNPHLTLFSKRQPAPEMRAPGPPGQ